MIRLIDECQGCEGNINDMNSFNDLIRALGLIDIPLGWDPLLGPISEPHPPLQSLTCSLSRKLGMTPFPSPLVKISQTLSSIIYPFSSILHTHTNVLIDSILKVCGWNIMTFVTLWLLLGHLSPI